MSLLQPIATPATTVFSPATANTPQDIAHAARVGAAFLSVRPSDLLLVDATTLSAPHSGIRYTFRALTVWDAPSAPLPL